MHHSKEVATVLTKLTTFRYQIPQGTPTSTMLANICLIPLRDRIREALPESILFSLWVDDINFSGKKAFEYIQPIIKCLQKEGYAVKQSKITSMGSSTSQTVTKLGANRIVSVPYKTLKRYTDEKSLKSEASTQGRIAYVKSINPRLGVRLTKKINSKNII